MMTDGVLSFFLKFDSIVINYNDKGRSELLTFSLEIPKDGN